MITKLQLNTIDLTEYGDAYVITTSLCYRYLGLGLGLTSYTERLLTMFKLTTSMNAGNN